MEKLTPLNALASTSMVDFYQHLVRGGADGPREVALSRGFTALWEEVSVCWFSDIAIPVFRHQ